jgi:hypothetical protein
MELRPRVAGGWPDVLWPTVQKLPTGGFAIGAASAQHSTTTGHIEKGSVREIDPFHAAPEAGP